MIAQCNSAGTSLGLKSAFQRDFDLSQDCFDWSLMIINREKKCCCTSATEKLEFQSIF